MHGNNHIHNNLCHNKVCNSVNNYVIMNPKEIQIKDYNYNLPDERIAKFPLSQRDHSKLLVYKKGILSSDTFCNICNYLPSGTMMVFNNTKVIQARVYFHKQTGALIEVFLLEPANPSDYELMFQTKGKCSWICMIGNLKKWKEGTLHRSVHLKDKDGNDKAIHLEVERKHEVHTGHWVDFRWNDEDVSFAEIIDACGELPIPPYLNRKTEESDKTTYQTVYSKIKGSVAAPTAGLHFTESVLNDIDAHHIDREEVTLHVGAGTFKPVKAEYIEGHEMHVEYISVHKKTIVSLLAHDSRCIAVGTTSVRTLESLYYMGVKLMKTPSLTEEQLHINQWEPYEGEIAEFASEVTTSQALQALLNWYNDNGVDILHSSTQIIIAPGYSYHVVEALVTNFHQPQSTLLLLVSALLKGDWRKVYNYALENNFRFLSYGDSSLLIP